MTMAHPNQKHVKTPISSLPLVIIPQDVVQSIEHYLDNTLSNAQATRNNADRLNFIADTTRRFGNGVWQKLVKYAENHNSSLLTMLDIAELLENSLIRTETAICLAEEVYHVG